MTHARALVCFDWYLVCLAAVKENKRDTRQSVKLIYYKKQSHTYRGYNMLRLYDFISASGD